LEPCWGDTPHAQWLAANAYRFGFIVRYPDGKTDITGYEYEPYHMRYVGIELATEMHNSGITTLEEFFGLPPARTTRADASRRGRHPRSTWPPPARASGAGPRNDSA
jgi:hypothetical protein